MRNKKKWQELRVGGTVAKSSTQANLSGEENNRFLEVFLVVFGFWWGPVGSQVGDPTPRVEVGVV